jgi:hypothetical protein
MNRGSPPVEGSAPSLIGASTFAEDRLRSARDARLLFDAAVDPSVLVVRAARASIDDADFDLSRFPPAVITTLLQPGIERVVITDGSDRLAFEVRDGSLLDGPVHLDLVLPRLRHAPLVCVSLQHLLASTRSGTLAHRPLLTGERRDRWRSALIAWDARARGASQREIGTILFGARRIEREWNQLSDSLRSQVRRLLGQADRMVTGGWRAMLVSQPAANAPSGASPGDGSC